MVLVNETLIVALAAWLTQIWDEEERLARDADVKQDDPVWWVSRVAMSWPQSYTVRSKRDNRPIARVEDVAGDEDTDITGILDGGAVAAHIAYHDPASVLARIAAWKKILELHGPDRVLENWYWLERKCQECGHPWQARTPIGTPPTVIGPERGCPTVRLLASAYADREGFQEAWR